MKMIGLRGESYSIDITRYHWAGDREISAGQSTLAYLLTKIYPSCRLYCEVPCLGTGLRLDFYIPSMDVAYEFDGDQHDTYTPFFHGSRAGFSNSQRNDVIKEQWCELNKIRLFRLTSQELRDWEKNEQGHCNS